MIGGGPRPRIRCLALIGFWAVASVALGARLVDLQVLRHDELAAAATRNAETYRELPGPRGRILDRHGRLLALSVPTGILRANPSAIPRDGLRALERAAGTPGRLIRRADRPGWLDVTHTCDAGCRETVLQLIDDGRVPEGTAGVVPTFRRVYPHGSLAAHVLGFVNRNGVAEGAERSFDALLRASVRRVPLMRDARQRVIDLQALRDGMPEPDGVVLSVDVRIQSALERELRRATERHRARAAQGVVMDPRSGEVLAMAAVPTFDPNRFGAHPEHHGNPVIRSSFEPGSVIKPLAAASVVEWDRYRPGDRVYCEEGRWTVGRQPIRDHDRFGRLTLGQVLEVSSNIGIAKFCQQLEPRELHETLQRLGLGRETGIDLPAEAPGRLPGPRAWRGRDKLVIPFGYGLSTTVLQLATAYSVLANGGYRVQPHIGLHRAGPDGRLHELPQRPARPTRVLSTRAAERVHGWLGRVISGERGTGAAAALDGYSAGGKTGTAERATAHGYSSQDHVTTFAGFAPVEDPAIVVVVSIDRPTRNGRMAASTAAPVFKRVAEEALRLLRVPPDLPPQPATEVDPLQIAEMRR
jgi:cell division protein FtsI (penicillin-binding protein 3)